jgi:hypothetical protein
MRILIDLYIQMICSLPFWRGFLFPLKYTFSFSLYILFPIYPIEWFGFNGTSYSEDNKTQVIVSEGQVAFAGTQQQDVVLSNRNQMSCVIEGGCPTTTEAMRTDKYLEWLKNQMVFENATISLRSTQLCMSRACHYSSP